MDRMLSHPRPPLLVIALVTTVLGVAALGVRVDNTPEAWLPTLDSELEEYRRFRDRFGEDSAILAVVKDPDLEDLAWREGLMALARSLGDLPGVSAVETPLDSPEPGERRPAPAGGGPRGGADSLLVSPLSGHLVSSDGRLAALVLVLGQDSMPVGEVVSFPGSRRTWRDPPFGSGRCAWPARTSSPTTSTRAPGAPWVGCPRSSSL